MDVVVTDTAVLGDTSLVVIVVLAGVAELVGRSTVLEYVGDGEGVVETPGVVGMYGIAHTDILLFTTKLGGHGIPSAYSSLSFSSNEFGGSSIVPSCRNARQWYVPVSFSSFKL